MSSALLRRLNHWVYLTIRGALFLLVLVLLIIFLNLASRPPRRETTQALFQGVSYTRRVRATPRKLVIHIVEVDLTAPGIRILVTPGDAGCGMETCAMTTGEFLKKEALQVAINGSFFAPFSVGTTFWDYYPHTHDPTDVMGLAISNGVPYSRDEEGYAKTCFNGTGAQITDKRCPDGTTQALAGRDILVRDGKAAHFDYADALHPRTALAVGQGGKRLWLIVVDGRQDGYSEGIDLNELAELIAGLGVNDALNLDGGGSTSLVTSKNGIHPLNAPIHTRIPMRQRPVANHLGIYALPLP